jgi:2-phosphoglycerate kinase
MTVRSPWDVLLLGGASGVGKSTVAPAVARHFGAALTPIDDFYLVVERMTSPERYPEVHRWRLHPEEVLALDDDGMLEHTLANASAMTEALEPVIAEHLGEEPRLVLEGDFLVPSLAVRERFDDVEANGRVRGVFLLEDEAQLGRNFADREGEEQPRRARATAVHSEWIRAECDRLGVPAVPARPWSTVVDRVIAAAS